MNIGRTSNEFNSEGTSRLIKSRRRRRLVIIIVFIMALIVAEFVRSNYFIDVEEFSYLSAQVPKGFDGAKIVQISDYHNHGGGLDDRLVKAIEDEAPDYIFMTGDMVDMIRTDLDKTKTFLEKVAPLGECYLVIGNHELGISSEEREELESCCAKLGIRVLNNECVTIERGGSRMLLVGTNNSPDTATVQAMLGSMPKGEQFVVWLHHYPEDFKELVSLSDKQGSRCDLMFTGHAHGGLVGLPFVGGLYAPGQGIFPEYTEGRYDEGTSVMYVSRGVGNSGYTKRFFDSFHLVVCTMKSAKK